MRSLGPPVSGLCRTQCPSATGVIVQYFCTIGERTAAYWRLDQSRVYLCAGALRKCFSNCYPITRWFLRTRRLSARSSVTPPYSNALLKRGAGVGRPQNQSTRNEFSNLSRTKPCSYPQSGSTSPERPTALPISKGVKGGLSFAIPPRESTTPQMGGEKRNPNPISQYMHSSIPA